MLLVDEQNFGTTIEKLKTRKLLSIDSETTGLRPYHGDRLFCISISDVTEDYYFNFHPKHEPLLTDSHLKALNEILFTADDKRMWVLHNAKFDMAMLAGVGCELKGYIHDTKTCSRVLFNERLKHDLATCAKDVGFAKDDAPEKYIMENNLWEWEVIPGKDARQKKKFYDRVPFDIIAPYACKDTRITYQLACWQVLQLDAYEKEKLASWPSQWDVMKNESKLTRTVYEMERRGVRINVGYCQLAAWTLSERMKELEAKFFEQTGVKFNNGTNCFKQAFSGEDITFGKPTKTGKVNAKFDSDAFTRFKHPAAATVLQWRDTKKTAEYFYNFLYHADKDHIVHANFNQDGTATGRFSSSAPNLQNLTKDEDPGSSSDFLVRRSFVPRDGYFFAMFDYDQMEYKLMLDYAGATELIKKVNGGMDVHQATADVAGITRSSAKTTNFSVLYGAGDTLLAERLKVSLSEAQRVKNSIFRAAPEIDDFINNVMDAIERRHFIFNWFGRRYNFPNIRFFNKRMGKWMESRMAYKGPNYLIQGGCADVVKVAMNRIHDYLKPLKSKMVLQIHDEVVIECHNTEAHILPDIKKIMESVYQPQNGLAMSVGVAHSFKNLADKTEGYPGGNEARNQISKQQGSTLSEVPAVVRLHINPTTV